jgi:hypothetical protein
MSYDVQVFVSETNKDPSAESCSYHLASRRRVLMLDPLLQKINQFRKPAQKITTFNQLYFKVVSDELSKDQEIYIEVKLSFPALIEKKKQTGNKNAQLQSAG